MALLCSKCGKNETTIHICEIVDGVTTTMDLCSTCAPAYTRLLGNETLHLQMMSPEGMSKKARETIVSLIQKENPSLTPAEVEMLPYVSACIEAAHARAAKKAVRKSIHVRADEILEVASEVATEVYGVDARGKLRTLGIVSSEALGEVIFRLIDKGILGKTADDRIEDFRVKSAFDEFMHAE